MRLYETHIKYTPGDHYFVIRSRLIDGKQTVFVYRSLNWLKRYCNKGIPYNWDVVKAHPNKWFLL